MKTMRLPMLLAAALVVVLAGCAKKDQKDTTTGDGRGPEEEVAQTSDFTPSDASPATPTATTPIDETTPAQRLQQRLKPVYYAFDKYDLTAEARTILAANASVLRETPGFNVVVEGHCDERGTNEYNLALGDRRARASRDYLISAGIPASRFTLVSYGEERPFAFGHDESSWWQNRRAHFVVPEP